MMLTKDQIMRKLQQNREKIRSFGVKRLTLFGSYAAGTAKNTSDIDFLVEFAPARGLYDDYTGLLSLLFNMFDKRVDLVKTTLIREELRSSILEGTQIEAQI